MKSGAVVIFDALGFSGIWQRFEESAIVGALNELRDNTVRLAGNLELHAHLFSDTVAIGVAVDSESAIPSALSLIVDATSRIVVRAAYTNPPLIFRGCIAVGKLIATSTVLVGEAVDRAARGHEQAEGAIVWFTEESSDSWEEWGFSGRSMSIVHTEVPLKSGSITTRAINPLSVLTIEAGGHPDASRSYASFVDATIGAFHRHSDGALSETVRRKQENTRVFLNSCQSYLDDLYAIEMRKLSGDWSMFGDT